MTGPIRLNKRVSPFVTALSSGFENFVKRASRSMVFGLLMLVRAYQLMISPISRPRCRFQPTCSEYAKQALEEHGVVQGLWLSAKRIGRCHPFSDGGVDLVPKQQADTPSQASNKS